MGKQPGSSKRISFAPHGLVACTLLSWTLPASGDEESTSLKDNSAPVEFRYDAPRFCPNEREAFGRIVGRSPRIRRSRPQNKAEIRLTMKLRKRRGEYHGILSVERLSDRARSPAPEEREMRGQSCHEVVDALALTAALSLDPEASYSLETSERTTENNSETESPVPLTWALGPQLSLEAIMKDTLHVGAGVSVSLSRLDGTTFMPLEIFASVRVVRPSPFNSESEAVSGLALLVLSYCPLRWGHDLALLVCPDVELGILSAKGKNVATSSEATRPFFSFGLGTPIRWKASQLLELKLLPALGIPLAKRRFALAPENLVVTESRTLTFDASLSLSYLFE